MSGTAKICEQGHEKICHYGRSCPMCGVVRSLNGLNINLKWPKVTIQLRATLRDSGVLTIRPDVLGERPNDSANQQEPATG